MTTSSRPGPGAQSRPDLKRRIVWILLFGGFVCHSVIAGADDHIYRSTWQKAKAERQAERWKLSAPLYARALRELEAAMGVVPEENRRQKRDLAEIRNEYGLTLLRVAWTQSFVSEDGVDLLQESRRQLDLSMTIAGELDAPGVLADAKQILMASSKSTVFPGNLAIA